MAVKIQQTPEAARVAIIARVNEELHVALEQLVVALQCEHVSMKASGAPSSVSASQVDKQRRVWGLSSAASQASDAVDPQTGIPQSLTALFHDERLRQFVVVWIATALTCARVDGICSLADATDSSFKFPRNLACNLPWWVFQRGHIGSLADATERFSRRRVCPNGWHLEGYVWIADLTSARVDCIGSILTDATERFSQNSCCRVGWAAEGACIALVAALKAAETDARRQSITNAFSSLVAQYSFSKVFDLQILIWWYYPATSELNMAACRLITDVRNRMMWEPDVLDTELTLKEKEFRIALDRQKECKRMAVQILRTRATALVSIIARVNEEYLYRSKRAVLIQKAIRRHLSRSEFQKLRATSLFHGHLILNGCEHGCDRMRGCPFTRYPGYPSPFFARPLADFIAQISCASRLRLARARSCVRPGAAWPLLHAARGSARGCLSAINQHELCRNRSREVVFIVGRLMVCDAQLMPTVYISDRCLLHFSGSIVERVLRGYCRRVMRVYEYREHQAQRVSWSSTTGSTMEEVD
jgi:hypothetical protein